MPIMKTYTLPLVAGIAAMLGGCSAGSHSSITITDDNGEKISVKSEGSNVSVSASDGAKGSLTVNDNGANISATDKNGETSTMTTKKDGSVNIQTKEGNASIGGTTTVSEEELGVPFYPGSTEKPGNNMKFEGGGEKNYSTVRLTTDSPDQVAQFYRTKVKGLTTAGTADAITGSTDLSTGVTFTLTVTKQDGKTEIMTTTSQKIKKS